MRIGSASTTRRVSASAPTAPAGASCGTLPCWDLNASGFKYKDKAGTLDGIVQVQLKAERLRAARLSS